MSKQKSLEGRDIDVPAIPDFSRLPFRAPEEATYREDAPPWANENPLYLAIPGPRTMKQVRETIEAGNPAYDPTVRGLSPEQRRERIDDVDIAMFALRRHVKLEDMVMSTIRNSFANRPWSYLYIQQAAARANSVGQVPITLSNSGEGSVGSGGFFGGVGEGKTASMKRILMACPQTILHRSFRGRDLGIKQVSWLYLSLPPKASAYGLLAWIASILDYILQTQYRDDLDRARNHTQQVRIIARALAVHAVGAIFCDEVQNVRVGSKTERGVLENTLQELINYTHARWVFIGTKAARAAIQSEALLRRMIGERGQLTWSSLAVGPDWDEFLGRLWERQVTAKETPLTPSISAVMHRLTGGIPDYAKRLFTAAQANIIGHSRFPDEQLTPEVLCGTMKESFSELHARLELRYKRQQRRGGDVLKPVGNGTGIGCVGPRAPDNRAGIGAPSEEKRTEPTSLRLDGNSLVDGAGM
jgi:hypothetical protein